MSLVDTVMATKTLNDLRQTRNQGPAPANTLTEAKINQVIALLKANHGNIPIKRIARQVELSVQDVREIIRKRAARIAALTP